jgi:hypothetical protein
MNPVYIYFIIFSCVGYLIVTDASVARLLVLLTGLARVQYQRVKWYMQHSPDNPLVKFIIHRRSLRLAKELMEELAKKDTKQTGTGDSNSPPDAL